MSIIRLRIVLENGRLGPGKIDLMEQIEALGSISAAGRALGMSYKRAWSLVEEINILFACPLVEKHHGGKAGGGASLTPLGRTAVNDYRELERATATAARAYLDRLQRKGDRCQDNTGQAR